MYIRCIYGVVGMEITKYTVIHGVYIRFWPALRIFSSSAFFVKPTSDNGKPQVCICSVLCIVCVRCIDQEDATHIVVYSIIQVCIYSYN
jgi:hypothetical protein